MRMRMEYNINFVLWYPTLTLLFGVRGLSFFFKKTQFEAKVFSLKKTLASNRGSSFFTEKT